MGEKNLCSDIRIHKTGIISSCPHSLSNMPRSSSVFFFRANGKVFSGGKREGGRKMDKSRDSRHLIAPQSANQHSECCLLSLINRFLSSISLSQVSCSGHFTQSSRRLFSAHCSLFLSASDLFYLLATCLLTRRAKSAKRIGHITV